jgi:hypothetical protein
MAEKSRPIENNTINAQAYWERLDKHVLPTLRKINSSIADFFVKLGDAVKRRYPNKAITVPREITVRGMIEAFLRFIEAVDVQAKIDDAILKGASEVKKLFSNPANNSAFMQKVTFG